MTVAIGRVLIASFLSGTGALGLQLAWTRRLAVPLGHEMPSALAVLSVFFVGMALGSALFARAIQRSRSPRSLALWLELAIAGWALISIPWMDVLASGLPDLLGPAPSSLRFAGVSGIATLLALLPSTAAMGATFAALERTAAFAGLKEPVPWIYLTNTLGAALGVVLALSIVQPTFGLRGATLAAATLHFLAALCLARDQGHPIPTFPRTADPSGIRPSGKALPACAWLALGGFIGIGSETLLIRLLAPVLGGTIYTHGVILAIWLGGSALGSWAASRWIRNLSPTAPALATVLGTAVTAVLLARVALPLLDHSRQWGTGFVLSMGVELLLVLGTVLPLSIPAGAWFTHWLRNAAANGVPIGSALAINTLAAAAAPVLWIGCLLPVAGESRTWTFLALLAGGAALVGARRHRWLTGAALAGVAVLHLTSDLRLLHPPQGARLVRAWCGPSDSVAVWEWPDQSRSLAVNNRFTMGGTASSPAAARHTHIPLLLHPAPRSGLVLGLGTGISFAAAGAHPDLEADGIELVPEVVAALPEFAPFNSLSPRLRVVTADARRFLRTGTRRYDVIIADLFHPERDGAAWLYTREHFAALKHRLAPGGVACQWLPWFQLDAPTRQSIVHAWLDQFPDSDAWLLRWTTLDTPVVGLISGATAISPREWEQRTADSHFRESLRRSALTDPWQLWGGWVGPATSLLPIRKPPARNTDDHPQVAWMAARGVDRARLRFRDDLLEWVKDCRIHAPGQVPEPDSGRWNGFREARDLYLSALDAELRGQRGEADGLLWSSLVRSPDFPTAYSHWIGRALSISRTNRAMALEVLTRLGDVRPEQPLAKELGRRLGREGIEGRRSQE